MSLEIGQTVGDYEIIGVIGAGGMGNVYKARNVISGRVDALKILLPDLRNSADLAERFLNEIKVLASLAHPNIAALLTALRVDNQLLMIMELVDGTNLDERLSAGPIPLDEGIYYISQMLGALSYAHARGVIHRDIKPANIAINSQGTVKLLDFGLARAQADHHLTKTGMVLGSLFYMSPEQVNGHTADVRSDIYSAGITAYRVIAGRRPIDGTSEFAVMRAQVEEVPLPPHHWNPSVPLELSSAIMRAIAKKPADRFQTAEEFRRALHALLPASVERLRSIGPDAVRTKTLGVLGAGWTSEHLSPTPIPSSTVFHAAALNALQKMLAQWLGPIAGALVKRYSRVAVTLPELCQTLATQIASEPDRQAFLKQCRKELGADVAGESRGVEAKKLTAYPPAQPAAWDPSVLERCRRQLATYVGPLAKVMVDRASKKAHSVAELYSMLSVEIPSEKDRERFLAARE